LVLVKDVQTFLHLLIAYKLQLRHFTALYDSAH